MSRLGNVDPKFVDILKHVCLRPAMYVGTASFDQAAIYLDGYATGRDENPGLHTTNVLHEEFQRFLVAKYGQEAAEKRGLSKEDGPLYTNVVWWGIYRQHFPHENDTEKLAILSKDFEDFANPLVRLATETGAGDTA